MAESTLRARWTTGASMFAQIENEDSEILNGLTFETMTVADWEEYANQFAEPVAGSGQYILQFPALPAGVYFYTVFLQAGAAPAATDTAISPTVRVRWDGAAFVEPEAAIDTDAIADAVLLRDWETMAGAPTAPMRSLLQAARMLRNRWQVGGTTLTVCDETDSLASPAWTAKVTAAKSGAITGVRPNL